MLKRYIAFLHRVGDGTLGGWDDVLTAEEGMDGTEPDILSFDTPEEAMSAIRKEIEEWTRGDERSKEEDRAMRERYCLGEDVGLWIYQVVDTHTHKAVIEYNPFDIDSETDEDEGEEEGLS